MAHFGSARSSRQVRPKAQHGRGRKIQSHLAELYGTEVLDLTLISRTTAPMPRRLSLPSQLSGGAPPSFEDGEFPCCWLAGNLTPPPNSLFDNLGK